VWINFNGLPSYAHRTVVHGTSNSGVFVNFPRNKILCWFSHAIQLLLQRRHYGWARSAWRERRGGFNATDGASYSNAQGDDVAAAP